jgi:hypothetical protein
VRSVTGGLWPLLGCACMYAAWRRNDDGVREVLGRHGPLHPYAASSPRRGGAHGVANEVVVASLRLLRHGTSTTQRRWLARWPRDATLTTWAGQAKQRPQHLWRAVPQLLLPRCNVNTAQECLSSVGTRQGTSGGFGTGAEQRHDGRVKTKRKRRAVITPPLARRVIS